MKAFFLASALSIFCSSTIAQESKQQFLQEAKAYCKLFQLDFWQAMEIEGLDASEKLLRFKTQFQKNIKSDEFFAITSNISENEYDAKKIYAYLQEKITGLTGESYHCPAIYTYYDELLKYRKD